MYIRSSGDITIDWTPQSRSHETEAAIAGGIVGNIIFNAIVPYPGGAMSIAVQDNLTEARTLFRQRFQTDTELLPALLQVNSAQHPETNRNP